MQQCTLNNLMSSETNTCKMKMNNQSKSALTSHACPAHTDNKGLLWAVLTTKNKRLFFILTLSIFYIHRVIMSLDNFKDSIVKVSIFSIED